MGSFKKIVQIFYYEKNFAWILSFYCTKINLYLSSIFFHKLFEELFIQCKLDNDGEIEMENSVLH